jgi:hypothetical protein
MARAARAGPDARGGVRADSAASPLARIAAGKGAFAHCGPAGADHCVRMVIDAAACAESRAHDEGAALPRGKRAFGLDAAAIGRPLRAWRGGGGWPEERAVAGETQPATGSGYSVVNVAVALRTPAPVSSTAAALERGVPSADRASGPARTSLSTQRAGIAADHKDKST